MGVEQHVNQRTHIGDGNILILVHIGCQDVDWSRVTVQEVINQGAHIGNGNETVLIHVAHSETFTLDNRHR